MSVKVLLFLCFVSYTVGQTCGTIVKSSSACPTSGAFGLRDIGHISIGNGDFFGAPNSFYGIFFRSGSVSAGSSVSLTGHGFTRNCNNSCSSMCPALPVVGCPLQSYLITTDGGHVCVTFGDALPQEANFATPDSLFSLAGLALNVTFDSNTTASYERGAIATSNGGRELVALVLSGSVGNGVFFSSCGPLIVMKNNAFAVRASSLGKGVLVSSTATSTTTTTTATTTTATGAATTATPVTVDATATTTRTGAQLTTSPQSPPPISTAVPTNATLSTTVLAASPSSGSNVGLIAGVAGGVAALLLAISLGTIYVCRRRRSVAAPNDTVLAPSPSSHYASTSAAFRPDDAPHYDRLAPNETESHYASTAASFRPDDAQHYDRL